MTTALPWHFVRERIAARIADLQQQLETVAPEDVRHLQGQIQGLRYIDTLPLNLPDSDQMIGDTEQK